MESKKRKGLFIITSVILIISVLLSTLIFGKSRSGLFQENPDDYITDLIDNYGMSAENYFAENWTAEINGKEVPFERKNEYQEQYLKDLIETTLQYSGITTYMQGSTDRAKKRSGKKSGNKVIEVAMAELGTKEETGKNDVKYNDWYYGKHVSGDGYDWCVVFVAWVANECGLLDDGSGQNIFRKCGGTGGMYNYLITHGQTEHAMTSLTTFGGSEYTPKPGDIFFLYDTSGEPGWLHIGFIAEIHEDYLVTIEGNWGNQVTSRELRAYNDNQVKYGCCIEINYPDNMYNTSMPETASEDAVYEFMISQGFNTAAACGVIANISEENSIFDTGLYEYGSGAGYGLIQWTGVRRDRLFEWLEANGYDRTSFEGQMYFMMDELNTYYTDVYEYLLNVPDTAQGAYDAGWYWCYWYERPGAKETSSPRRGAKARDTYFPIYENYYSDVTSDDYFEDALFVGDSRIVGLMDQEAFYASDMFAKVGIGNSDLATKRIKVDGVGTVTLKQLLTRNEYGKIYLCNGINSMYAGAEGNFESFKLIYDQVREYNPDAIIFIQSIIPTSYDYMQNSYPQYFNAQIIADYNSLLKDLCDEDDNTYFIDVASLYTDSDGYLDTQYSNDGLHLTSDAQQKWVNLLARNKK